MEAAGKAASLHELALDLAGVHRLDVAIQKLQQALELKPDFVEARHDLARLLAQQGRRAPQSASRLPQVRRVRAHRSSAHGGGKLERAEVELRFAADRHPENPDAQCALAVHLVQTGHYSEALRRFQSAVARDPECLKSDPEWQAAYRALTRRAGEP